jgi:hypothetical protein
MTAWRLTRARRTYTLRLAQSGKVNLNKNLACGVGCMRLLACGNNFLGSNHKDWINILMKGCT